MYSLAHLSHSSNSFLRWWFAVPSPYTILTHKQANKLQSFWYLVASNKGWVPCPTTFLRTICPTGPSVCLTLPLSSTTALEEREGLPLSRSKPIASRNFMSVSDLLREILNLNQPRKFPRQIILPAPCWSTDSQTWPSSRDLNAKATGVSTKSVSYLEGISGTIITCAVFTSSPKPQVHSINSWSTAATPKLRSLVCFVLDVARLCFTVQQSWIGPFPSDTHHVIPLLCPLTSEEWAGIAPY